MTIQQRSPLLFAPIIECVAVNVFDVEPSSSVVQYGQLNYTELDGGAGHYDYLMTGSNLTHLSVLEQTPSNGIDLTELPLLKRETGINAVCSVVFTNGKGVSDTMDFNFADYISNTYISAISSAVVDSYAEYSLARIAAIFDNLTGPEMFDGSKNRAFPLVIPHAHLTGHVFGSTGRVDAMGKRFMAITPRHVVGLAHYTYQIGDALKWKDASNNIVTRTVLGRVSMREEIGVTGDDWSLYLLSSDLPASIAPFPIVGDWFYNLTPGYTDTTFTAFPQGFGMVLFNNDGHIVPWEFAYNTQQSVVDFPTVTVHGINITALNSKRSAGSSFFNLPGKDWSRAEGTTFYHYVRGGDSGSAVLVPVADDKWALVGIYNGGFFQAALINSWIAWLDNEVLGISTSHTVTVAPDPTL